LEAHRKLKNDGMREVIKHYKKKYFIFYFQKEIQKALIDDCNLNIQLN
jgi:hypothetical protein